MPLSIVKTAAFRPMPSVSTPTTVSEKAGFFRQRTDRIADVAHHIPQGLEPPRGPDAAGRFGRQRDVAEFLQRRIARIFLIRTIGDLLLRGDRQVRADFFLEIVFVEFNGPPALQPRQDPHGYSSVPGVARSHHAADGVHQLAPPRFFANELLLAFGREAIELRALVGLAHTPLGLQPSALHEALQRGIERAGFDLEQVIRLRPDRLADAVAVLGPPLQGAENEHVEGALEQLQAPVVGVLGHSRRQSTALDVGRLRLVPRLRWPCGPATARQARTLASQASASALRATADKSARQTRSSTLRGPDPS